MNTTRDPHLTDDQFAECMMGGGVSREITAHLAVCDACRAEAESFTASVESFNTASLAWSEQQPAESLRPLVREGVSRPVWAAASWALAGCLAVVSAVSVVNHRDAARSFTETQTSAETEDTPAQIERDNKLLLEVAAATSVHANSPLAEYGLESNAEPSAKAGHARNRND